MDSDSDSFNREKAKKKGGLNAGKLQNLQKNHLDSENEDSEDDFKPKKQLNFGKLGKKN